MAEERKSVPEKEASGVDQSELPESAVLQVSVGQSLSS
jgi:hypothetical protein